MRYLTASGLGLLLAVCVPAVSSGATFPVTSTSDRVDSSPGNGTCRTSAGTCTLRAAVQEANALPGADTIVLRSATYALTLVPGLVDGAQHGDLDVTGPLTLAGAGATATIVSARSIDRVLEVHPGAGDVTLRALTLRDGRTALDGGLVFSRSAGRLRIEAARLTAGTALGRGGAIAHAGARVEVDRSTLSGNTATVAGGAVHLAAGSLGVTTSTLSGNRAALGGALRVEPGASAAVDDSTVAGATAAAAGISRPAGLGSTVTVRNAIVAAGALACDVPLSSAGGSLDAEHSCGLDRSGADPLLAPLASNGGATQTHALGAGSPARDLGVGPCPATDQRGAPRPQGAGCDAGAFEATPAAVPPPDLTPPDTRITSAPADPSLPSVSFAFAGSDDRTAATALTFSCRLDGGAWAACASPDARSGLAPGAHAFEVRAADAAGNVDPTPGTARVDGRRLPRGQRDASGGRRRLAGPGVARLREGRRRDPARAVQARRQLAHARALRAAVRHPRRLRARLGQAAPVLPRRRRG